METTSKDTLDIYSWKTNRLHDKVTNGFKQLTKQKQTFETKQHGILFTKHTRITKTSTQSPNAEKINCTIDRNCFWSFLRPENTMRHLFYHIWEEVNKMKKIGRKQWMEWLWTHTHICAEREREWQLPLFAIFSLLHRIRQVKWFLLFTWLKARAIR